VIVEARSDPDLLRHAAGGDRSAFDDLYARHHRAVFGFAWRFTRSVPAAEDTTQDTFVTMLLEAGRFKPERSSLRSWLLGITRNLALKRYRKLSPEQPLDSETEGSAAVNRTPLEEVLSSEVSTAVRAAVGSLPPRQREALILFEYEGLAMAEIAGIVGADLPAIKSRLHRARERLRVLLAPLQLTGGHTETKPWGG
jgi:RNA polymerase sigma-70 factor (ECF subfamily)